MRAPHDVERGLEALRRAVLLALRPVPAPAAGGFLLSEAASSGAGPVGWSGSGPLGDEDQATSSEDDAGERERMIALVELARTGDKDAFGLLYDHYHVSVYRFLYYRTRSASLAEDLTSDTFFRALRSMNNFRWQGRDFTEQLGVEFVNFGHGVKKVRIPYCGQSGHASRTTQPPMGYFLQGHRQLWRHRHLLAPGRRPGSTRAKRPPLD